MRAELQRCNGIGFDDVRSVIDDHTRLASSEILPDKNGATLPRAGVADAKEAGSTCS